MNIALITLFPDMFDALNYGITARAKEKNLLQINFYNPRHYTHDARRTVDDTSYGGGPGMVMKYEPLRDTILDAKKNYSSAKVYYLSPQGIPLTQEIICKLSQEKEMILLAGRYEGIDQRLIDAQVDAEYSIGDYVLTGGELPAMVMIDAVTRFLPGALGDEDSAEQDSFMNGLLDYPHYTRPEEVDQHRVPEVLLSGNHERIRQWRLKQSLGKTWQKRPDLVKRRSLSAEEKQLLNEFIAEEQI